MGVTIESPNYSIDLGPAGFNRLRQKVADLKVNNNINVATDFSKKLAKNAVKKPQQKCKRIRFHLIQKINASTTRTCRKGRRGTEMYLFFELIY